MFSCVNNIINKKWWNALAKPVVVKLLGWLGIIMFVLHCNSRNLAVSIDVFYPLDPIK